NISGRNGAIGLPAGTSSKPLPSKNTIRWWSPGATRTVRSPTAAVHGRRSSRHPFRPGHRRTTGRRYGRATTPHSRPGLGREWGDWGQPAQTGPTLRSHAAMVLGSRIAVVWFGG